MTDKLQQMDDFCSENINMPDGAFFAMAEEQGILLEDWEWYSEQPGRGKKCG